MKTEHDDDKHTTDPAVFPAMAYERPWHAELRNGREVTILALHTKCGIAVRVTSPTGIEINLDDREIWEEVQALVVKELDLDPLWNAPRIQIGPPVNATDARVLELERHIAQLERGNRDRDMLLEHVKTTNRILTTLEVAISAMPKLSKPRGDR